MDDAVSGGSMTPRWWWYAHEREGEKFGPIEAEDEATAIRIALARARIVRLTLAGVEEADDWRPSKCGLSGHTEPRGEALLITEREANPRSEDARLKAEVDEALGEWDRLDEPTEEK